MCPQHSLLFLIFFFSRSVSARNKVALKYILHSEPRLVASEFNNATLTQKLAVLHDKSVLLSFWEDLRVAG